MTVWLWAAVDAPSGAITERSAGHLIQRSPLGTWSYWCPMSRIQASGTTGSTTTRAPTGTLAASQARARPRVSGRDCTRSRMHAEHEALREQRQRAGAEQRAAGQPPPAPGAVAERHDADTRRAGTASGKIGSSQRPK